MRLTMTAALAALLMAGGQAASAGPLPTDKPERPAVSAPRLLEPKLHLAGSAAGAGAATSHESARVWVESARGFFETRKARQAQLS